MIDVTDTSDSRVHKGKKGKVRVHSEHYVCLTDNPVLCKQVEHDEGKRQRGARTMRRDDAPKCSTLGGSDRKRADHTRAGLQQKQAQLRVVRSNNAQLKRKLNTVESRVKRDSSKYKKQREEWENDRVSSGSKRKQGSKEGDKPHDEGPHNSHHPMGQHRTGHADERGGNCKRHRQETQ